MPDGNQPNLITPDGLNYECTGCGKCCSGWSVPLTKEDYERVSAIDWQSIDPNLANKKLFRPLSEKQKSDTPYTHAINATAEGQCPFLKNNLCFIHSTFDSKTKPSMCQLFPYSFNETPGGVYVSVSFVSRGAIFNAGKALNDQNEYLLSKYKDFKNLFGDRVPNWSQIKLSANVPLTWDEYINIENQLLAYLKDKSKTLESRFIDGCNYLNSQLAAKTGSKKSQMASALGEMTSLNSLDKIVLASLYKTYFPGQSNRPQGYGNLPLSAPCILNEVLGSLVANSQTIAYPNDKKKGPYYDSRNFSYNFAVQLIKLPWTDNMDDNDIIYRFFYSHIFGKHYFCGGLGQLSLITGFNHLAILLALIKLHARKLAAGRFSPTVEQIDVVQTILELEKSLGELKVTAYGAALLELLLASAARVGRILRFTL